MKSKYTVTIEKIGRKWITVKVTKKDGQHYYIAEVLKNELSDVNININDTVDILANFVDKSNAYGKKYIFENAEIATDEKIKEIKEQLRKSEVEKWIGYINNAYDNGDGYIYSNGIQKLHDLCEHSYDNEIEKMKKVIAKKKEEECAKKKEQREKERIADGLKTFARADYYEKGATLIVGTDVYETLYSKYQNSDGFSFGVMQEEWYEVTAKRITDTAKGQEIFAEYQAKQIKNKEDAEIAQQTKKAFVEIKKYIKENGILNSEKTTIDEIQNDSIIIYDTFNAYGTGEKIIVKNNCVWLVTNNGADGDSWDINTIYTGGAGAYGIVADINTEIIDMIKKYMLLTNQNVQDLETLTVKNKIETVSSTIVSTQAETIETQEINFEKKTLAQATEIIKDTLNDIKNSYLQLGNVLKQVKDNKIYKDNYKNFVEYVKIEFDMSKSQAYAYIKVYEMYGNDDRLKEYNFTQLKILAENSKTANEICNEVSPKIKKEDLIKQLKKSDQSEKSKVSAQVEKIKVNQSEKETLLKALRLLKLQDSSINIDSIIKKIGGK